MCRELSIKKDLKSIKSIMRLIKEIKPDIILKEKIEVIENGIDIDKFTNEVDSSSLRRRLGIKDDELVIGMVARITEQKSPYTFLNIAEQITKLIPEAKCIFVGDGDLKDEIQLAIEKRGLKKNCLITGWVELLILLKIILMAF